ncbi:PspC domain-containing protein [Rhodococcus sp. NPDC049939]|uniref:PspC domain-containing protein n=1 Tax=Rhodococcus sp. NPDC049939 TaxID=3155511 RepID=UPI003411B62A
MTFDSNTPRQFARSGNQKMLGGVAEHFGLDVNVVWSIAIIAAVVTGGTAALVYLAAWMLMPFNH